MTTTSTTPPSVSFALRASSVIAFIPLSVVAPPISTGRPATATPIVASIAFATAPAAT